MAARLQVPAAACLPGAPAPAAPSTAPPFHALIHLCTPCSIARCMAAPQIRVDVPPELAAAGAAGPRILPRASVVVHGGDLCYPSPTGAQPAAILGACALNGLAPRPRCRARSDAPLPPRRPIIRSPGPPSLLLLLLTRRRDV